jgi:glycine/D-amino acid oxidase-like deaminating enzyme
VRQSIMAVGPNVAGLPDALYTAGVSLTRRGESPGAAGHDRHLRADGALLGHDSADAPALELEAAGGREWKGGVFSPTDGIADTSRAVPIAARGVMKAGGWRTNDDAQAPPAMTATFVRMVPFSVTTPLTRPPLAVGPNVAGLPDALYTAGVSLTRRGESGGYNLAIRRRPGAAGHDRHLRADGALLGHDSADAPALELEEHGRATGREWKGGVFSPTDGIADTSRAVPIAARGVMKAGGTVHQPGRWPGRARAPRRRRARE